MSTIYTAYEKLYESMTESEKKKSFIIDKKNVPFSDMSHFVGLSGSKYASCKTKLLLVGRAVNGWRSFPTQSREDFARQAEKEIKENKIDWIKWDAEKKELSDGNDYSVSKSAFWKTSRNIWKQLPGIVDVDDGLDDIWTNYIAWSNLYKIAPKDGGNPTERMCNCQKTACIEILKAEIEIFNPTHILFITDLSWFDADFEKGIFNTVFDRDNIENGVYVRASGIVGGIKVVVSCRPECVPHDSYVKAVVDEFEKLNYRK